MLRDRTSIALLAVLAGLIPGSATGVTPAPPKTEGSEVRTFEIESDLRELTEALEEVHELLESRAIGAGQAPLVDADALLSIDVPEHRSITQALNLFSTRLRPKIQASLHRSAQYKPMVDAVLDEHDLPRALAYLPVIESAYVPTLTSRAGARGLWQFMPETARAYGLRVDWWVDERNDPVKSTRAAAAFLRDLYAQFGSWPEVLAAYNAGPGRLKRSLGKSSKSDFWRLYEQGKLPKETRGYVPTFYATLLIASDPETYGFSLLEPFDPGEVAVPIAGPVSLDFVAETAGVDPAALRAANPMFVQGVLPPGQSEVRMCPETAASLAPHLATLRFEDPNLRVASFTLRPGDTLSKLSRATGIPVTEIRAVNSLGSKSTLRPGEQIYIPVRQTELSTMLQRAASAPADRYYKVRKGDTLFSIARNHGLTLNELLDLNHLKKSSKIHPGDRIRISVSSTVATGGM